MMMMRILFGIGCIIVGVGFVWYTYKHPTKPGLGSNILDGNLRGYHVGFGFIIIGVLSLLGYGHW